MAVVLLAVGCSGGDDPEPGPTGATSGIDATTPAADTTTEPTRTTTAVTSPEPGAPVTDSTPVAGTTDVVPRDDADPTALAGRALLTIADFPEGWVAIPPDGDDADGGELDRRVDDCVGLAPDAVSRSLDDVDVEAPGFELAEAGLGVEQGVVIADDIGSAIQIMTELGDAAVPGCFVEVFTAYFDEVMADPAQTDFPAGTEIGELVAEEIEVGAERDDTVAFRYAVPLRNDGDEVTVLFETWYVRSGRAVSRVLFQSIVEPFPEDGVASLMGIVSERLTLIG